MSERIEALLAELVEIQRQQLANQSASIEQQRLAVEQQCIAVERQQRVVRLLRPALAVVIFGILAILLPYLWQWIQFLSAS